MISTLVALALAQQTTAKIPEPVSAEWWQARHNAVLNRVRKGHVDLVFIGDSITHAFGGEPDTKQSFSNRGGDTWDLFYGSRRAINLGFSGDRTQNVLWRINHGELDGIAPKLVVIMIGTNNVGAHGAPAIAEGVMAICDKVRLKCPKSKILVLGIFPRGSSSSSDRARVVATNQLLAVQTREKGYEFADIGSVFLDSKGEIPKEVMPDLLHPFQVGYRRWAMTLEPFLARLLGDKPRTTLDPHNSAVVPVTQNRDYPLYDWMPRHQAILEYNRVIQPNVIFVGDSIIHYFGGQPADGKHTRGSEVWNATFAPLKAANLGFGWDRTENVLWRIEQGELTGISPKAIVLLIGTNNLDVNTSSEIRDGVQAIVDLARVKQPQAWILLLGVLPRGQAESNPYRVRIKELNALLEPIGKTRNVIYRDIGSVFLETDGSISRDTMSDFLHPTPLGYAKFAGAVLPILKSMMFD